MEFNNLDETMEIIRKIYTCEISMFDEDGDDWSDEFTDFYESIEYLVNHPEHFNIECIPKFMVLFDQTINYDSLMSKLVNIVVNIVCYYGQAGLHKLFESFRYVKDKGKAFGKITLLARLMNVYYDELKVALSSETDDIKKDIEKILLDIKFEEVQKKKIELLAMIR